MPKIKSDHVRIRKGDVDEMIDFQIFYRTGFGFYAQLPTTLEEAFDSLTEKEQQGLFLIKEYPRKWKLTGPHKKLVYADTEDDLKKRMTKALEHLFSLTVKRDPVIVLWYENRNENDDDDDDQRDPNELKSVGLELKAKFCNRITTASGEPKYYSEYEAEWFGEMQKRRDEVYISRHDPPVIIPDTPENRQFVQELHKAIKELVKKLESFTKTPASVLKAIESRQKLLS